MPRLFVAIDVPQEVKDGIARIQRELPPDARRVDPSGAHLTLKFLGEEDPAAIAKALADIRMRAFDITLDRVGGFPSETDARVCFLGGPQNTRFSALADAVDHATAHVLRDFPPVVHATVARFPAQRAIPRIVVPPITFAVREFCLYESRLVEKGPVYVCFARFPLDQMQMR